MLTEEFIAGFVSAVGSFMFVHVRRREYPVFQIKTSIENKDLLQDIVNTLEIKKKIYTYKHGQQSYALLLIRDRHTLVDKLIPILDGRIDGVRGITYSEWKARFLQNSSTWSYRNIRSTVNPQRQADLYKNPNRPLSTRSVDSG